MFIRGTYGKWTEDDLDRASTALQNGDAGLNAIAKAYGVPKATLKRHLDGGTKYANGSKIFSGRPQTLPPELEAALVEYVLDVESMLIGLSRTDLMELAYQLSLRQHWSSTSRRGVYVDWPKQNRSDGVGLQLSLRQHWSSTSSTWSLC